MNEAIKALILRFLRIFIIAGLSAVFGDMASNPSSWVPLAYVAVFTIIIDFGYKLFREYIKKFDCKS